jgi:Ca2+-binding EF-hand superfamily protein
MGCTQHFKAFDKDNSGDVSKEEFLSVGHRVATPGSMFEARDENGDGKLTEAEFCAAWGRGRGRGMGPGRGSRMGPGRGMGSRGGPGMMGRRRLMQSREQCMQHFKRFDKDSNGSISEEEFIAFGHGSPQARTMFKSRDADNDGRLSRDELCARFGRMRGGEGGDVRSPGATEGGATSQ